MTNDVLQSAALFSKVNKRKQCWRRIVAGLSAVVVFVTTYALLLPAITQSHDANCGYEEHTHEAECFSGSELICEQTAHVHNALCYSDRTADVETAEDWEATLPKELSGDWSKDLLAIAKSQLGYMESTLNIGVGTDGVTRGYTRYGAWAKDAYGDWQTAFVSFCLHYAKIRTDYFPFSEDRIKTLTALETAGFYHKDLEAYTPKPGDLVFFGKNVGYDHVGIVTDYYPATDDAPAQLRFIEGDADNRVAPVQCAADESSILGFASVSDAYKEFSGQVSREKEYSDESVKVLATYFPAAGIPDGAELVVKVIDPADEAYESYYKDAFSTIEWENGQIFVTKITDFRLYDISFIYKGKEIQPTWDVDVQISYPDAELKEESGVSVVHYKKDKKKPSLSKLHEYKMDESGRLHTKFKTDSFSLFAVVTTETEVDYIVGYDAFSVTADNLSSLNSEKPYAIVSAGYALTVGPDGKVTTKALNSFEHGVSGHESLIRWIFEKASGSNYYLKTQIEDQTYYLQVNGSELLLNAQEGTAFTAARSSANVTLKSGSNYITVAEGGASMGASMALSLYQATPGAYTVTFDGQLGAAKHSGSTNVKYPNGKKVNKTSDTDGFVTLPTAEETTLPGNYPMRLNGWFDIINRVFYDSTMLGQQIKVTGATTLYPEWVAETYDIGQNIDVIQNQPDTSDFINTHVYDYTELFNLQSTYYDTSDSKWYLDTESELGFIFFDWITSGNIGHVSGKDSAVNGLTVNQGKGNATKDNAYFPGAVTSGIITDTLDNDKRINALFGQDYMPGRHYLGEGDWLYQYDSDTGYYFYNSVRNAASYNQSEQRFYVYDYAVKVDSSNSNNDFLPLNYGSTEYAEKDTECNYWFGMMSEIKFYLPFDSGSGNNKAANGIDDMQFRFSGDDDVWVFVDGQLALDLGGVHDRVYGEINFSTGKVKVGQASGSSNASNTAASREDMPGVSSSANATGVTTYDLPDVFKGGQEHTITMCYLERGASLSNCSVYFNLSPLYKLEISKSDKENASNLSGAEFQIFADPECTKEADLYYKEEDGTLVKMEHSRFTTDANGLATCYGLFSGQTYYIKETMPPLGYADLSEYVIEFNLTKPGISKFIILDSNGEQWEFARGYLHQEGTEHRIELDIYNDQYIGGDKQLYVEKVWGEGSKNIPDEITVRLMANGNPTTRKMVLNAANNWKGIFYELPETDSNGEPIVYSVRESNAPSGYTVTYEQTTGEITEETTIPGYWTADSTVTSFTDGGYYRFVTNSRYAVQCDASGTIQRADLAEIGDANFESQLWKAVKSGSYYSLQNVAYPEYYLTLTSSTAGTTDEAGDQFQISSNRLRKRVSSTTYYYLRDYNSKYTATSRSSSATTVSVTRFNWTEPQVSSTTVQIPGWKVVNTPWKETFTIPLEKQWDGTVADYNRGPVTMGLYQINTGDEAEPLLKATVILNEENGWKGSFKDVSHPLEGTYYCVMEMTGGYLTSYEGTTVTIFSGEEAKEAARVVLDEYGETETIIIKNAAMILLPDTGGTEIWLLTCGGVLMATSAVLLLIPKRKKQYKFKKHS